MGMVDGRDVAGRRAPTGLVTWRRRRRGWGWHGRRGREVARDGWGGRRQWGWSTGLTWLVDRHRQGW
jgi:hypothetical protein